MLSWTSRTSRYDGSVLRSLENYVRKHRLLHPGERVGVAVSGGADSVALLRALADLAPSFGVVIFVLHLNHRLRGKESDADERFVRELAAQYSLEAVIESEDVAALAALFHLSLEAAGRRARYAFFQRAAVALRLNCVATAHTRDDQAETVLLRVLRGAGTSGLAGIHSSFDLGNVAGEIASNESLSRPRIVRPFLSTTRREVEEYLTSLGQNHREDSSNLSPEFLRNRVRATLLPTLEADYNPRLRDALCETAEIAAAENEFFDRLTLSALGQDSDPEQGVALQLFQEQPLALQRRILRNICRPHALALDFAHLEALRDFALAGCAGRLKLPRGFVAEVIREKHCPSRLVLRAARQGLPAALFCTELPVPGKVPIRNVFGADMYLSAELLGAEAAERVYTRASLLSLARTGFRLAIRNLLPGDRFHPLHSSGERKVNRLLQELSVPAMLRRNWPVVLAEGHIVWVPGLPVASRVAWFPGEGEAIVLAMYGQEGAISHE